MEFLSGKSVVKSDAMQSNCTVFGRAAVEIPGILFCAVRVSEYCRVPDQRSEFARHEPLDERPATCQCAFGRVSQRFCDPKFN
jgi:hypothetical protein